MMKANYRHYIYCVLLFSVALTHAETDHSGDKMDHSQHQTKPAYTAPVQKGELAPLSEMPASGVARESGSDGRYLMEPTSASDTLQQLCAKGTRALVMLDDKTWEKCGGKPQGAAEGPGQAKAVDHSQHQMH